MRSNYGSSGPSENLRLDDAKNAPKLRLERYMVHLHTEIYLNSADI